MSFDRLVVLCRHEEVVVGVFRGEVVGAGEYHRVGCPRLQKEQEYGVQGRAPVVENTSG